MRELCLPGSEERCQDVNDSYDNCDNDHSLSFILSVLLRQLQISDNIFFVKFCPFFSIKGSLKNMKLIGLHLRKNRF